MGIEEFASVTREILNVKIDELSEDWSITSVPLGGYKDAKNGYPKIRIICRGSSPERRILKILDLDRIANGYELVASYIPDYERVAQDNSDSGQKETLSLSENRGRPNLEVLAGQDEYTAFIVSFQTSLAIALERDKDPNRYKIN